MLLRALLVLSLALPCAAEARKGRAKYRAKHNKRKAGPQTLVMHQGQLVPARLVPAEPAPIPAAKTKRGTKRAAQAKREAAQRSTRGFFSQPFPAGKKARKRLKLSLDNAWREIENAIESKNPKHLESAMTLYRALSATAHRDHSRLLETKTSRKRLQKFEQIARIPLPSDG